MKIDMQTIKIMLKDFARFNNMQIEEVERDFAECIFQNAFILKKWKKQKISNVIDFYSFTDRPTPPTAG